MAQLEIVASLTIRNAAGKRGSGFYPFTLSGWQGWQLEVNYETAGAFVGAAVYAPPGVELKHVPLRISAPGAPGAPERKVTAPTLNAAGTGFLRLLPLSDLACLPRGELRLELGMMLSAQHRRGLSAQRPTLAVFTARFPNIAQLPEDDCTTCFAAGGVGGWQVRVFARDPHDTDYVSAFLGPPPGLEGLRDLEYSLRVLDVPGPHVWRNKQDFVANLAFGGILLPRSLLTDGELRVEVGLLLTEEHMKALAAIPPIPYAATVVIPSAMERLERETGLTRFFSACGVSGWSVFMELGAVAGFVSVGLTSPRELKTSARCSLRALDAPEAETPVFASLGNGLRRRRFIPFSALASLPSGELRIAVDIDLSQEDKEWLTALPPLKPVFTATVPSIAAVSRRTEAAVIVPFAVAGCPGFELQVCPRGFGPTKGSSIGTFVLAPRGVVLPLLGVSLRVTNAPACLREEHVYAADMSRGKSSGIDRLYPLCRLSELPRGELKIEICMALTKQHEKLLRKAAKKGRGTEAGEAERQTGPAGIGIAPSTAKGKTPTPPPACDSCGAVSRELLWCEPCMLVRYCNVDCQRAHRKKHKKACKAAEAAKQAAAAGR